MNRPIIFPAGRRLRIVICARYSTDEQNPNSIADQFAACRRFLKSMGVEEATIDEYSDEEISGEVLNRPGIDKVREGIQAKRWDLLVSEESSRLFRHPSGCLHFFEIAFDLGMRLICLNDCIDTTDEDWQDDLLDAQKSHKRANKLTRKRILRSFEARWESGYAVTWLRPGYRRNKVHPDAPQRGKKPSGPFVDEIDPQFAPLIEQAFEKVACGDDLASVARWLNEQKAPRSGGQFGPYAKRWNELAVLSMVRDRIYIGVEENGKTTVNRQISTGVTRQDRNEKPTRTRSMPHFRIISDALWHRANKAIDSRRRGDGNRQRGASHPLAGIPRDSRSPLSKLFCCYICRNRMNMDGRNEGGYRCSVCKKGGCWNRTTALRDLTHERLSAAISGALLEHEGTLRAALQRVVELAKDASTWTAKENELKKQLQTVNTSLANLGDAIERTPKERQAELLQRYQARQDEQQFILAELEEVRNLIATRLRIPTEEEAMEAVRNASRRLLTLDLDVKGLLRRLLAGPIFAVPFRQLESDKIILRAWLKIHLLLLLPHELRAVAEQQESGDQAQSLQTIDLQVDLFDPPDHIRFLAKCVEAKVANPGLSLKKLGELLQLNRMTVRRALQLRARMTALGVTDPYVEVAERPVTASRWRPAS